MSISPFNNYWRTGQDSNPRAVLLRPFRFQGGSLKPLEYLSIIIPWAVSIRPHLRRNPMILLSPSGQGKLMPTDISSFYVFAHMELPELHRFQPGIEVCTHRHLLSPGRLPTCRESNPLLLSNIGTPWLLTHRKGFAAATIFRQLNELLSA